MTAKPIQRASSSHSLMGLFLGALTVCCAFPAIASVVLAWPDTDDFALFLPPALAGSVLALFVLPFWHASALKRSAIAAIALVSLVLTASHLWPEFSQRTREAPPRADAAMVILYWKMDRNNQALDKTVNILRASKADALMLEETNSALGMTLDARLQDLYPYRSLCKASCGYAIYSRRPVIAEQRWKPDSPPLIWIRTADRMGKPATLVSAHIPGDAIRSTSAGMARELPPGMRGSMVVVGDMNMMPWSHTMRDLDQLLRPMTRQTRWLQTWPGQFGGQKFPFAFLPFDQVYIGDTWKEATISRIQDAPSGHYPLLISLSR